MFCSFLQNFVKILSILLVDFEHRFLSRMVQTSLILSPVILQPILFWCHCHWVVLRESLLGHSLSNNTYTRYLHRDFFLNKNLIFPLFGLQVLFIPSRKTWSSLNYCPSSCLLFQEIHFFLSFYFL